MGKLDDYNFNRLPQPLTDFKDAVRNLFNFGKFQAQVVSTVPTFAGRAGEITVYRNGTDGRIYYYLGSSWNLVISFTADGS